MPTSPPPRESGLRRGLVLGGGGITGIAWETGLLHGLAEAGVDLTVADRVVGTSAGSIVGAQITGGLALDELYARQTTPPGPAVDGDVPLARVGPAVTLRWAAALVRARGDVERFARILGEAAITAAEAGQVPTVTERYRQVALRIGGLTWPDRDLAITAVDAGTGRLVVFRPDRERPDVTLEDAVNASCAVPLVYPPIPIGGRPYLDGGVHSASNARLAIDCDRVIALTPADRSIGPMRSAARILADHGVEHLVLSPDRAARRAIGRNVLDPTARPAAARAGHAQAAAILSRTRDLWG